MTPWQLRQAIGIIRSGGIIAYPTEAVYGLGCDPLNRGAVETIYLLKNRSPGKGLILIASSTAQIEPYINITPAQRQQLGRRLARPVTWVVPASVHCPHWLTGNQTGVAVRITRHPAARALCQAAGHPLVSTSANISQGNAARTALDVRRIFRSDVDRIIHGATGQRTNPSEIRDMTSGKIYRPD